MPTKKSYLARLPKSARTQIETIMRERDGNLSFVEYVAQCWDLDVLLRPGPFSTAESRRQRFDENRRAVAAKRPDWTSEQIDDYMRLAQVPRYLREIAIARRCALDDAGELGRLLAARNRLRRAGLVGHADDLIEPCAVGDVAIAREIAAKTTLGCRATVSEADLHTYALHALLIDNRIAFKWLVEQFAHVSSAQLRPWLTGIFTALEGVAAGRPENVAQGLAVHIQGLHKMQQRDELDGAFKLGAHAMYRLFESLSPALVSKFDPAQDFPWDAPFHSWVSDHPDPVAGWDLSGTPPLIQQIVGRGEQPDWLRPLPRTELEIVLLGGDANSKPLLEEIEQFSGGNDGTVKRAKLMLERCPVVLCWGIGEDIGRAALEACQQRLVAKGGRAEVRPMQPSEFRWFSPLR